MDLTSFNHEKEGKEYIYLVMVEYKDKTLLKVGYTKTIDGRMDTYELHNPDIQLLKIREGTRGLEDYMHKKFEKYAYPKRKEWFYYNEEIVNSFDTLEEKNFLDIDKLKNKIINLLKPKSVEELKKIYYERYQEEIEKEDLDKEELDYTITNIFSFINENIENSIDTFDYSEIPLEIDSNTRYQIIIPNPISSENISMDLEQIIGRQRLDTNPWKNCATMYVKCTSLKHKTTKEEFDKYLEKKTKKSERLLETYIDAKDDNKWDLAENYQKVAKVYHYKDDYVAVTRIINQKTKTVVKLKPVFNKLVLITEERAFELQQSDYADRFSVFTATQLEGMDSIEDEVERELEEFNEIRSVKDKLKFLVEYSKSATKENLENFLELIPGKYKDYYLIVGPDIITACSYTESDIKKRWMETISNGEIKDNVMTEIYKMFKVGQRYTKSDIKDSLNNLYQRLGYQKKAKATDLELYYIMKYVKFQDSTNKWVNGFELIGKR